MKPPLFNYAAPETIDEAVALRAGAADSVILAGGQSLIPTLNFRLARPETVIDIGRIKALQGFTVANGAIVIRAMARQREVELSADIQRANPLIRETLGNVAHAVVRNRGTVVGSIAHADAAAELPTLLLALGGTVVARGPKGERPIAADDFFRFHMTTSLAANELATEVRFPALKPRTGYAFLEYARRHGDYALAGVCALLMLDGGGKISAARLAACGIAARPLRLGTAEAALNGAPATTATFAAAARAAREAVNAPDDRLATNAYRRHLLDTLVRRALELAHGRAREARVT